MTTPNLDEITNSLETASQDLKRAVSGLSELWKKYKQQHPSPPQNPEQTYHCFVAAYKVGEKVVPVVTHTLFFASLPLGGYFYLQEVKQPATFLGGYKIRATPDGFSRSEQAWFGIKDPFHSQKELVDALDQSLQESYDTYTQFVDAVQQFVDTKKIVIVRDIIQKIRADDPRSNLEGHLPFDKGFDAKSPYELPPSKGIEKYLLMR